MPIVTFTRQRSLTHMVTNRLNKSSPQNADLIEIK